METRRVYFYDASVLVESYIEGSNSEAFETQQTAAAPEIEAISRVSLLEITSLIVQRSSDFGNDLSRSVLFSMIEADMNRFQVVEMGGAVINRAISLIRRHGLKALQAIQLASALLITGKVVLLTLDPEIEKAAKLEGLEVVSSIQPTNPEPSSEVLN